MLGRLKQVDRASLTIGGPLESQKLSLEKVSQITNHSSVIINSLIS